MKTDHSTAYVRQEDAPLLPPPRNETGIIGWFKSEPLGIIYGILELYLFLRLSIFK